MDYKSIAIGFLVGLVALFGGLMVSGHKTAAPVTTLPGALTGPDIPSPYLNWGGVRTYNYSMAMTVASTTCSFVTPAATSTLTFAAARVDQSSIGATLVYAWGKDPTSAYATTTSLGTATLTTGARGVILATTTQVTSIDDKIVFGPSQNLNFKVGSSTPTTQSGTCYVQFIELP